jgi:hypothetical protein
VNALFSDLEKKTNILVPMLQTLDYDPPQSLFGGFLQTGDSHPSQKPHVAEPDLASVLQQVALVVGGLSIRPVGMREAICGCARDVMKASLRINNCGVENFVSVV